MPEVINIEVNAAIDEIVIDIDVSPIIDEIEIELTEEINEIEIDVSEVINIGLSAYDIAVQKGYQGIEAQWLVGLKGRDGTNGIDGAAVVTVSGGAYEHTQNTPSNEWIIDHNLGFFPSVTVEDSSGQGVRTDIRHDSRNRTRIISNSGFSGKAYFS